MWCGSLRSCSLWGGMLRSRAAGWGGFLLLPFVLLLLLRGKISAGR
jgi:hypothetical protein